METEAARFRFMEHTEMECPVDGCGSGVGDVVRFAMTRERSIEEYAIFLRCNQDHEFSLRVTTHDGVMIFGLRPELLEEEG